MSGRVGSGRVGSGRPLHASTARKPRPTLRGRQPEPRQPPPHGRRMVRQRSRAYIPIHINSLHHRVLICSVDRGFNNVDLINIRRRAHIGSPEAARSIARSAAAAPDPGGGGAPMRAKIAPRQRSAARAPRRPQRDDPARPRESRPRHRARRGRAVHPGGSQAPATGSSPPSTRRARPAISSAPASRPSWRTASSSATAERF